MPIALRWSVLSLLTLLGLAGLVQLPLVPPLASRTGAGTERVLADLATQEAQLDTRERARQLLSRFLGAEITRYFWGGFSSHLDVLGLETPEDMQARISEEPGAVQLSLVPLQQPERYLARVEVNDAVPRGLACRGAGQAGRFSWRGDQLQCPPGWQKLELPGPLSRSDH